MPRTTSDRDFALVGARARVDELQAEVEAIFQRYPELRQRRAKPASRSGRSQRQFSKAGKRAISEGMRKYWARRKAAQAKAQRS